MNRFILLLLLAFPVVAQEEREFTDPLGGRVVQLSDAKLCPRGANFFYSYTNQFSRQGHIVFDCSWNPSNPNYVSYPIFDKDLRLVSKNGVGDAGGHNNSYKQVQWSQEREVLFGIEGAVVREFDPFARKNRVFADFSGKRLPDGKKVSAAQALSVGPGDRLLVHLQAEGSYEVVAIGTYDPADKSYHFLSVPVPGDVAPHGFDEAQWSQNPKGRVTVVYGNAPNFSYNADLTERVQYDDNHGHRGFFCGSNGHCYKVNVKNDTLPKGGVGQIGCKDAAGKFLEPWRPENAIYDDETGKRVFIFGCDFREKGINGLGHVSRSLKLDVFWSGEDSILRNVVKYDASGYITAVVTEKLATSHAYFSKCGYWHYARPTSDATGTRALYATTREGTCQTDVRVVEKPLSDPPPQN